MRYFGAFSFDETHGLLWHAGVRVPMTAKACAVLACLLDAGDRPVTKDEILRTVWHGTHVAPDNIKVLVREIRHALGDDAHAARYIRTFSLGSYAFIAPVHKLPPSSGSYGATLFCGRHRELKLLTGLLPGRDTQRTLAVVTGPLGIGKTALTEQVLRSATLKGCLVVRGQCVPSSVESESYGFLLDTINRLMNEVPRVRALVEPHAPELLAHLYQPSHTRTRGHRHGPVTPPRLFRELIAAFEAVAVETPLVLAFTDVQWLHSSDVDVLGALVRRRHLAKLTILATARPLDAFAGTATLKQMMAELQITGACTVVPLGPLGEADIGRYAVRRFGPRVGPIVRSVLDDASQRHPLLLQTAADALVHEGVLHREKRTWRVAGDVSDIRRTVGHALGFIMERQIDQLTTDERTLLVAVSGLGREFSAWTAAQLMGGDPGEVGSRLDRLARQGDILVHADAVDPVTGMRFRFRNTMFPALLNHTGLKPAQTVAV